MPLRVDRGGPPRQPAGWVGGCIGVGLGGQARGRRLSGVLVVGAAVVDDLAAPRRLLAARRSAPSSLAGGWELPGGKVEPGEDPQEALHRELREELGVAVRLGAELLPAGDDAAAAAAAVAAPAVWPLPGVGTLRVWWAVVAGGGEPAPLEDHDALRWLELDDWVGGVAWLPADMPVVTALRAAVR